MELNKQWYVKHGLIAGQGTTAPCHTLILLTPIHISSILYCITPKPQTHHEHAADKETVVSAVGKLERKVNPVDGAVQ